MKELEIRHLFIGHRCPHKFMLDKEVTFVPKCDLDFELRVDKIPRCASSHHDMTLSNQLFNFIALALFLLELCATKT